MSFWIATGHKVQDSLSQMPKLDEVIGKIFFC